MTDGGGFGGQVRNSDVDATVRGLKPPGKWKSGDHDGDDAIDYVNRQIPPDKLNPVVISKRTA